MRKKPITEIEVSFDVLIARLEEKILMIKKCQQLSLYFLPVSHSRETYIIEMRKQIAIYLIGIGANKSDISKVFGKKPSTIIHLLEIDNHKYIVEDVSNNYLEWIESKLYPKTIHVLVVNEFSSNGYSTRLSYKLSTGITK